MPAVWCLKAQVCRLGLRIRETYPKEPNSLQTERLLHQSNTTWRYHFCACYEKRRPVIHSSGRKLFQIVSVGTSLTIQWLGLQASLQGARVWYLVGELWSRMQRGVPKTKSMYMGLNSVYCQGSAFWLQLICAKAYIQRSFRVPGTRIGVAESLSDRWKFALLTEFSLPTENINARLLQSGPESLGSCRGSQEALQRVHYRVTAWHIRASIFPCGHVPSSPFNEKTEDETPL